MSDDKKRLSDMDIAVALESISGSMSSMALSIARIETTMDGLPCDSLTERIVRLEMQVEATKRHTDELEVHKEKLYKITGAQGGQLATVIQAQKGESKLSDRMWGLIVIGIGSGASAITYLLVRVPNVVQ
jgi:hypothetical protein